MLGIAHVQLRVHDNREVFFNSFNPYPVNTDHMVNITPTLGAWV